LKELEHNIEQTVVGIDPEALRKVSGNILKGVDTCLLEGGKHFQPSAVKLFCKFFL
jgi:hypothetical protein